MNIDLDLQMISASAVAVVPVIVALVQTIKMTSWLDSKFSPIVAIGFGVIIAFLTDHETSNVGNTLLTGVIYGLSASGLYSGVKATAHAVKNERESL